MTNWQAFKHRGWSADLGEWLYGGLVDCNQVPHIFPGHDGNLEDVSLDLVCHPVTPETVGRFTGSTDDANAEIYEGDRVEVMYRSGELWEGVVQWDSHSCCFFILRKGNAHYSLNVGGSNVKSRKVTGCIHKTPIFEPKGAPS